MACEGRRQIQRTNAIPNVLFGFVPVQVTGIYKKQWELISHLQAGRFFSEICMWLIFWTRKLVMHRDFVIK